MATGLDREKVFRGLSMKRFALTWSGLLVSLPGAVLYAVARTTFDSSEHHR
jgi:hypothetical protein